jgi:predicted aldo/keto reductase-like oxidoreductase
MKTIRLGSQGAQVPQLGLGCMRMSGPPPTRDDAESVATIIAALDAGVRFLSRMLRPYGTRGAVRELLTDGSGDYTVLTPETATHS